MSRTQELLDNCIGYLAELWEREGKDEWDIHWLDIVGMSEGEMLEYGLTRDEE